MLRFLFPRLTAAEERGAALFSAITARAREAHWYVAGGVADTLDGRFRMLATITALVILRLEQDDDDAQAASVALTERFIHAMESEHREMGLGDPTLGRTVRKLVGSLSRRVDLWRSAVAGETGWNDAVRESLHGSGFVSGVGHSAEMLRAFWLQLQRADPAAIAKGEVA